MGDCLLVGGRVVFAFNKAPWDFSVSPMGSELIAERKRYGRTEVLGAFILPLKLQCTILMDNMILEKHIS